MIAKYLGSGALADVAFHQGRWWCVWHGGSDLHLVSLEPGTLSEQSWTSWTIGEPGAFPRLLSWVGRLWLAHREGAAPYRIVLREVGTSHVEHLDIGHGADPVALGAGDVAWQATGGPEWQVWRKPLVGAEPSRFVRQGRPTGLSRVLSDGAVKTVDEDREALTGYTRPCWAGDLVVAEGRNLGAYARLTNGRELIVWPGQEAVTPRCATDGGELFGIVTWGREGVRFAEVTRSEFVVPSQQPQPERLPEGTEIDLLPYIVGETSTWPRHGDHYMHHVWDGRNLHFLKFGPMSEGSTFCDNWERLVLDGDQFYLREDRSQSGAGAYSFHPGTAFRRRMKVGEWIDVPNNVLQRYDPKTCEVIDQHPLPYRIGLVEAWKHFDCGGDLGVRNVIKCGYDPGNRHDTIEYSWYADGASWFRWQEQRQDDPSKTHTQSFNRIGGVALTPTQGCWRRDLVPWPPNEPEPVEPEPIPTPKPDPTPEPVTMTTFRTSDGTHYLCAEGGGGREIVANRTEPGAWETFEVIRVDPTHIALKASNGQFVCAESGGGRELVANRSEIGAWETFEVVPGDGGIALRTSGGQFVCAENGGGGVVVANRSEAGAWETFETSSPLTGGSGGHVGGGPVGASVITGRLRKEGRALADDAGYSLPVFCHSGTGIADLLFDEGTERQNARLIKSVGFAGRRVWTRLRGTAAWSTNPKGWGGREFGHETMGHDAYRNLLIASFLQHEELGLKLVLSAGDIEGIDSEQEIRTYVRLLGDALETVSPDGSLCSIFEPGNELPGIWRNGSPERSRDWILKPFKARFPSVLCTNSQGANESREERFRWCLDPADLDDIHSFRDNHWFDWIRHVINNAYVHEHGTQPRELIWGSEPFGTGRLVSVQPNIHEFDEHVAQISVIAHLMTGQIPCYFCSPGIRFDVARDLYGETYEAMPGFATCASVASLLPTDIMTWPRENIVHGGREDPPGSPNPIFQEPGSGEIDRAYHVFSADHQRFAALIFGGESLDSRAYRPYHADVDHRFGARARLVVGRVL